MSKKYGSLEFGEVLGIENRQALIKHRQSMHIIVMNLTYQVDLATPAALLARYFSLTGWAGGLVAAGGRVTVWQRFHRAEKVVQDGVTYHFVSDAFGPSLRTWQRPYRLFEAVCAQIEALVAAGERVVVHWHGLIFPWQLIGFGQRLRRRCPLVVQHHGALPSDGWRYWGQRWAQRWVDGYFFTNQALAQAWVTKGLIRDIDQVQAVMETSSALQFEAKERARAKSGLKGAPILLWVGNLKTNKDPLTILAGMARLLPHYPQARLYMAYRETPLLAAVEAAIADDALLQEAVTLLGPLPYAKMGDYFNSADLFVQGSGKEAAGIALLDAMCCGAIPVVTAIPAFETITDNGRLGALWPVGDVAGLVAALWQVLARPLPPQAQACRAYFAQKWSFAAIGRCALAAYERVFEAGRL